MRRSWVRREAFWREPSRRVRELEDIFDFINIHRYAVDVVVVREETRAGQDLEVLERASRKTANLLLHPVRVDVRREATRTASCEQNVAGVLKAVITRERCHDCVANATASEVERFMRTCNDERISAVTREGGAVAVQKHDLVKVAERLIVRV
jgi:hypothetical protein